MALLVSLVASPGHTEAASAFASPTFQGQWQESETIAPNFWGPIANAKEGQQEVYGDAQRLVQYFDKGRMEITRNRLTNGLLATELVRGRIQTGDATFENRPSPAIPIAGDPDNVGPTYATLTSKATALLTPAPSSVGMSATAAVDASGAPVKVSPVSDAEATIAVYDTATQHNVPAAFATYRDHAGLLTIGYALSEPFRATVKVGGTPKDVMIQVFERRVLTYTSSNAPAFRVEMGNIGQHYYQWRYPDGASSTSSSSTTVPQYLPGKITFETPDQQIFTINPDGTSRTKIADGISPLFSPDGTRVAFIVGTNPKKGEQTRTIAIRSVTLDGSNNRDECIIAANVPSFAGAAMRLVRWSPSGRYIARSTTQNGPGDMQFCDTTTHTMLDRAEYVQGAVSLIFDWTPDGTNAVWQASIVYGDGKDLFYGDPGKQGEGAVQLTHGQYRTGQGNSKTANSWFYSSARISPDGKTIAVLGSKLFFLSVPGRQSPLDGKIIDAVPAASSSRDASLAWSPDGRALAVSTQMPSSFQSVSIVDVASGRSILLAANGGGCDWTRQ